MGTEIIVEEIYAVGNERSASLPDEVMQLIWETIFISTDFEIAIKTGKSEYRYCVKSHISTLYEAQQRIINYFLAMLKLKFQNLVDIGRVIIHRKRSN